MYQSIIELVNYSHRKKIIERVNYMITVYSVNLLVARVTIVFGSLAMFK